MISGWSRPNFWSFLPLEPEVAIYFEYDWLIEDLIQSCEERIRRRFAEMGVHFEVRIPDDLPELPHYPRRPRSVWG